MKADIFKKFIKEAVREAIQEELKDVLLEAFKSNKQTIKESNDRTLSFNTNSIPHQPISKPSVNPKQAYMEILGDIAKGPKSGFEGEFKVQGHVDPINGSLPEGQLGLDQIMGLINK
jgi:hypothetical protein